MAPFTADFEKGTHGNTIATTDPGSATPWDVVNGTPTYDNTHAAHGALAAKIPTGADIYCRWNQTSTEEYGRLYLYATAVPTSSCYFHHFNVVLAAYSDGKIGFNTDFTDYKTTTNFGLNQHIRVEWHVIHHATTGLFEFKLFNDPDSTTPTETILQTNKNTGASNGGTYSFGNNSGTNWGSDFWLDDIVANATSYPGPLIIPNLSAQPIQSTLGW